MQKLFEKGFEGKTLQAKVYDDEPEVKQEIEPIKSHPEQLFFIR